MIYPPEYHLESDEKIVFDAIDALLHATLLVPSPDGLQVSFTPCLLDRQRRMLRGHIARRNPQSELFDGRRADVIFHGPHAYISPKLKDNRETPTWNYVNVHVTGRVSTVSEDSEKWLFLLDLIRQLEGSNTEPYLAEYAATLRKKLHGITVFEVEIEKLQGRFKLDRNDGVEHQQKAFEILAAETPASLIQWLRSLEPQ